MKHRSVVAVLGLLFIIHPTASGQMPSEDSAFYQSALTHTIQVYQRRIDDQSALYNGSVYAPYEWAWKGGTPYFIDTLTAGSVVYDGMVYDSLKVLYEDLRQFFIVKNEALMLQLVKERVSSFVVDGHHFIRLKADNHNPGLPRTGFYEILYSGQTELLKETVKSKREEPSIVEGILHYVDEKDNYYIRKKGNYVRVNSKRELLDALDDRRKEVQRFLKKNKLNMRKGRETALIQAIQYYDKL